MYVVGLGEIADQYVTDLRRQAAEARLARQLRGRRRHMPVHTPLPDAPGVVRGGPGGTAD
jgi:hypothetical protein